ncbi:uncharacterized protein ACJ7VT_001332 [Polymixia lowei]
METRPQIVGQAGLGCGLIQKQRWMKESQEVWRPWTTTPVSCMQQDEATDCGGGAGRPRMWPNPKAEVDDGTNPKSVDLGPPHQSARGSENMQTPVGPAGI